MSVDLPGFSVVPGAQVSSVLDGQEKAIIDVVEQAYRLHGEALTINPRSYFLRFPDRPTARIIALPASLGGDAPVDGIKWISSFPTNLERGIPRASAVLILNDPATGYPIGCLESSIISASRTAASAALAAGRLSEGRTRPTRIGFVGAGLIARYIHTYLKAAGWSFEQLGVHDLSAGYAQSFGDHLRRTGVSGEIVVHDSHEQLVRDSDLVVYATTAGTPHVHDPSWFAHNPLVLHVSLRDLGTEVILSATNVVDDVHHCLTANTSVHLAEQQTGNRDFLVGTLHDVLTGAVRPDAGRPLVFSPFGLGVLDLAVGRFVYDELARTGQLTTVDGFFHDLDRYGSSAGRPA
ncbi:2,3-diaminopropionate biosynthesis protein SbnB [Micromonospora sp. NPDC049044]|uniref:2,3-diaminopropionate biosynthesis protein SbnB n=1 Tax=unclassified Micromonospora TaxID=2617518 RepID=UPI0033F9044A